MDMPITSIHFCYWDFFEKEFLEEDSISHLIYFEKQAYPDYKPTSIMDEYLKKEVKSKNKIYEICQKIAICDYFHVNIFL